MIIFFLGVLLHDLFVGLVSIVIGITFVAASSLNWDFWFMLPKLRWIDERWGRHRARTVSLVFGIVCIALGIWVMTSTRMPH